MRYCSDYSLVDNEFYFDRLNPSSTNCSIYEYLFLGILAHLTPSLTFTELASFMLQMKCVSLLSGKTFYYISNLFEFKLLSALEMRRSTV